MQLAARAAMASAMGGNGSESEMEELYSKLTNGEDIGGMRAIMTKVVGEMLHRKSKVDELESGLNKEVRESGDLREKLELFGAGVFQEGTGLGMRLDTLERECKAFGERVDTCFALQGAFEVDTRAVVEK